MHEQDEDTRALNRRRLIRRAGTVAAGLAGAGVVGAVAGSPASAAPGEAVLQGVANNAGTTTTTLTGGTSAEPTLKLGNSTVGGPALQLAPLDGDTQLPSATGPVGSIYVDDYGDVTVTGQPGSRKYNNMLYSPTWATMVVPLSPTRWVDTRNNNRYVTVLPGSGRDSLGRIRPTAGFYDACALIDFSDLIVPLSSSAVQANLTILQPAGQGYASLWDQGQWGVTSSINYGTPLPEIANFTQTLLGTDGKIRFKTNQPVHFIIDIVGFVVSDPDGQLVGPGWAGVQGFKAAAEAPGPIPRRG